MLSGTWRVPLPLGYGFSRHIVTHSSLTLAPRPILTRRHDSSVGGATCQAKGPVLIPNGDIRYDLKNPYPKLWFSQAGDFFNIYFYKRGNRGRLIIDGMILTILPCLNPTPPSPASLLIPPHTPSPPDPMAAALAPTSQAPEAPRRAAPGPTAAAVALPLMGGSPPRPPVGWAINRQSI